jgi:chemotaxis-related protein WspD
MSPSAPDHPEPARESDQAVAILRLLDRPLSDSDLAEGARWAARPAEVRSGRTMGVLLFRIGQEVAGLPAKSLRRVTPAVRPSPIPHRTSPVLGLGNIRGELVLCADLRGLLGLPASQGADVGARRMVVIGPAADSWAFEVDALIGIERLDPATLRPPPVTVVYSMSAFTLGLADVDGRRVTVLDGERVLAGFKAALS